MAENNQPENNNSDSQDMEDGNTGDTPEIKTDGPSNPASSADPEAESQSGAKLPNNPAAQEPTSPDTKQSADTPPRKNKFKSAIGWAKSHKRLSIPIALAALLALLLAIPVSRYPLLGTVVSGNYKVSVIDSATGNPVSNAEVSINGRSATTDKEGVATVRAKVGKKRLTVSKNYYHDMSAAVLVPLTSKGASHQVKLEATGRQVPLTVINKINRAVLANVSIKAADTEARTDDDGKVTIVLPADKDFVEATISADGFNQIKTQIKVTDQAAEENGFELTPAGKVYFLSKQSGKVDVIKTDLDGANRETVLAGTGNEDESDTVLFASRDWKHLALKARRDDKTKLYLINTSNDQLTTMDEGDDVTFNGIGWHDGYFVYTVSRNTVNLWESKKTSLKSYSTSSGALIALDDTDAVGTGQNDFAYESYSSIHLVEDGVVYGKFWYRSWNYPLSTSGKKTTINSVRADGSEKKVLKEFSAATNTGNPRWMYSKPVNPTSIYFSVTDDAGQTEWYYEANTSQIRDLDILADQFNKAYPAYLVSPDGTKAFWYEERDGKNTLLTGSSFGGESSSVAVLDGYVPYGWHSQDYLLVSKSGSELYVMPTSGINEASELLKISDYHRPNYGYGYGYGGY